MVIKNTYLYCKKYIHIDYPALHDTRNKSIGDIDFCNIVAGHQSHHEESL